MTIFEFAVLSTFFAGLIALFTEAARKILFSIPSRLFKYLIQRLTIKVVFTRKEPAFEMIRDWLSEHPYAKKARFVKMIYDQSANQFRPVPGHGLHWLWFEGPLWIRYGRKDQTPEEAKEAQANRSWAPPVDDESYTVTMISPNHDKLNRFMTMLAGRFVRTDERPYLYVYTYHGGYWQCPGGKRKRDMKTIYMPDKQKADIVHTIQSFLESEEWYMARGIPWRMGMEFEGPPGTGKTTLATGLAGLFNKPLFCMNLNNMYDDESLQRAFSQVTRDGIILIEDIDSFDASQRRAGVKEEAPIESNMDALSKALGASPQPATATTKKKRAAPAQKNSDEGVTLSGLLNAIDGVAATEGRILIMTTNDPDKLDPALVRAGRVDKKVVIGPLGPVEVEQMFLCFFPEASERAAAVKRYAAGRVKTASAWQALFIKYHDSLDRLFAEVIEA